MITALKLPRLGVRFRKPKRPWRFNRWQKFSLCLYLAGACVCIAYILAGYWPITGTLCGCVIEIRAVIIGAMRGMPLADRHAQRGSLPCFAFSVVALFVVPA